MYRNVKHINLKGALYQQIPVTNRSSVSVRQSLRKNLKFKKNKSLSCICNPHSSVTSMIRVASSAAQYRHSLMKCLFLLILSTRLSFRQLLFICSQILQNRYIMDSVNRNKNQTLFPRIVNVPSIGGVSTRLSKICSNKSATDNIRILWSQLVYWPAGVLWPLCYSKSP